MRLTNNDDRSMLIIRMQAYAYEHVILGDMGKVEQLAENALRCLDVMMENNPCTSSGFWANFYFQQFVDNHKAMVNIRG